MNHQKHESKRLNIDAAHQCVHEYILETFLFGSSASDLQYHDSLFELGVVDSIGVLGLVSFLESEFGFSMELDDVVPDNLDSINAICKYLLKSELLVE